MTELLTPDDIAAKLKLPKRHTMELLRSPHFPAPAINQSQKLRRWTAQAVEAWIEAQARKNSRNSAFPQ